MKQAVFAAVCLIAWATQASAFECGGKRYCRQMTSCEEARFHLTQCGQKRLDGDNDGSPCENLCGDGGNRLPAVALPKSNQCGAKSRCGEMDDCDEAKFYLNSCGVQRLDRDGDGVP